MVVGRDPFSRSVVSIWTLWGHFIASSTTNNHIRSCVGRLIALGHLTIVDRKRACIGVFMAGKVDVHAVFMEKLLHRGLKFRMDGVAVDWPVAGSEYPRSLMPLAGSPLQVFFQPSKVFAIDAKMSRFENRALILLASAGEISFSVNHNKVGEPVVKAVPHVACGFARCEGHVEAGVVGGEIRKSLPLVSITQAGGRVAFCLVVPCCDHVRLVIGDVFNPLHVSVVNVLVLK
mmetsp:Transcript_2175/g.4953  ORF Transcript_2175/g.4953 Transcript_2175/m.4953 type:complete len:232 (+) Transcript_2175:510-1205(+)